MIQPNDLPDWLPFVSLVTGKMTRQPVVTKLIENLVLGVISAAFSFVMAQKLLEQKVEDFKAQFAAYVVQEQQSHHDTQNRLDGIEKCLRERTCTK